MPRQNAKGMTTTYNHLSGAVCWIEPLTLYDSSLKVAIGMVYIAGTSVEMCRPSFVHSHWIEHVQFYCKG